ncbi:MAG: hypothetical protein ACI3XF_02955, partial [Eubacteriales bacterium]
MAENVIETLKFKVEADTSGAQKQLERLKKNLEYFKRPFQPSKNNSTNEVVSDKSIKNVDAMNSSLKKLQDSMKKYGVAIEKVKLQYSGLKNISGSRKSGFSFGDELDAKIEKAAEASREIKDNFSDIVVEGKNLEGIIENALGNTGLNSGRIYKQLTVPLSPQSMNSIQEQAKSFDSISESGNRFLNFMNVAKGKLHEFGTAIKIAFKDTDYINDFDNLSNGMKKLSLQANKIVNFFKSVGNQFKKLKINMLGSHSIFDKFTGMLSRILRYRIITGVLNQITDGFKEGTDNLYQYSKIAGTDFAVNMDNAATSLQYFRNSLGAVASPIINALIPYFEALTDKIVEGINWLNQFIAKITGATTWTKAIRQQKEYAEAADETAKAN